MDGCIERMERSASPISSMMASLVALPSRMVEVEDGWESGVEGEEDAAEEKQRDATMYIFADFEDAGVTLLLG